MSFEPIIVGKYKPALIALKASLLAYSSICFSIEAFGVLQKKLPVLHLG